MKNNYEIIIVGGGIVGCSVIYTLANFSDAKSILLLERGNSIGKGNSNREYNSKTLHEGFAETNYSLEKVLRMKLATSILKRYVYNKFGQIPEMFSGKKSICYKLPFFVLAQDDEVNFLESKYEQVRRVFPDVRLIDKKEIEKLEPNLVKGRREDQRILALYKRDGIVIDFGSLAEELLEDAIKASDSPKILFNQEVKMIKEKESYIDCLLYTSDAADE